MYPPAPDMREADTQNMTDGELFYIVQNGIRLTGMPVWGSGSDHDAEDSWKLVRFIRHLPKLTVEEGGRGGNERAKSEESGRLEGRTGKKEFLNGDQSHERYTAPLGSRSRSRSSRYVSCASTNNRHRPRGRGACDRRRDQAYGHGRHC